MSHSNPTEIIDAVGAPPRWDDLKGNVVGMFGTQQRLYAGCGRPGDNIGLLDCSGSMRGVPHQSVSYFIPDPTHWQAIQADIREQNSGTRVSDVIINFAVHMSDKNKGVLLSVVTDGIDNRSDYTKLPDAYEKTFEGAVSFFVDSCAKFQVSPNLVVICMGGGAQELADRISKGTKKRVAVGVCTPEMTIEQAEAVCRFASQKATTSHKASLSVIGIPKITEFEVVDMTQVIESQQKAKAAIIANVENVIVTGLNSASRAWKNIAKVIDAREDDDAERPAKRQRTKEGGEESTTSVAISKYAAEMTDFVSQLLDEYVFKQNNYTFNVPDLFKAIAGSKPFTKQAINVVFFGLANSKDAPVTKITDSTAKTFYRIEAA